MDSAQEHPVSPRFDTQKVQRRLLQIPRTRVDPHFEIWVDQLTICWQVDVTVDREEVEALPFAPVLGSEGSC